MALAIDLFNRALGNLNPAKFAERIELMQVSSLGLCLSRAVANDCHSSPVSSLHLEDTDHRYLLAGAADGTVYIHDLQPNNKQNSPVWSSSLVGHVSRSKRHRHQKSVDCVQWYSGDNGIFTTSSMDGKLKIWDANLLRPAETFDFDSKIYCHQMAPSATNPMVAVATSLDHVKLVDLRSGASTHILRGHNEGVLVCKWSPNINFYLATGSKDGKVLLWDIRRGKSCLHVFDYNNVRRPKRNLGEKLRSNCERKVSHDGAVNGVAFSEDGLVMYSFGRDERVRKWSLLDGKNLKARFPLVPNKRRNSSHMTLANKYLFIPSQSYVHVLDTDSEGLHVSLSGHYNSVNCCTYNKAHSELYSGGNDRNILLWTSKMSALHPGDPTTRASNDSDNINSTLPTAVEDFQDAWSDSD